MRKIIREIIIVGASLFLVVGFVQAKSFWQHHLDTGEPFITYQERVEIAKTVPIANFSGSPVQNDQLYDFIFNKLPIETLGSAATTSKPMRPSEYSTTLASSLAEQGTETTLKVNSVLLKDGTTLRSGNYGDFLILTVGSGDSEEKIAVSTLNSSTKVFTILSRGLEYGRWASTTANMHLHLPGERVFVSNDDYYLYKEYINKWATEDVGGVKTFVGNQIRIGDGLSASNKCIYTYNSDTYSPFVCYDEGTSKWLFSNNGVDTYDPQAGGGGLAASGTLAIRIDNSRIGIRLNPDDTTLKMYPSTPTSTLGVRLKPNGGVVTSTLGVIIDPTVNINWTGLHNWTSSSTFVATSTWFGRKWMALQDIDAGDAVSIYRASTTMLVTPESWVTGKSVHVQQGGPNTNYDGSDLELNTPGSAERRIFMHLNASSSASSFTFRLYQKYSSAAGPFTVNVEDLTAGFSLNTVTWNNQPAVSSNIDSFQVNSGNDNSYFNVTVSGLSAGQISNVSEYGFRLSIVGTANYTFGESGDTYPSQIKTGSAVNIKYPTSTYAYLADANGTASSTYNNFIGFAANSVLSGNPVTVYYMGIVGLPTTTLQVGSQYYLTDTAGSYGTRGRAGTYKRIVGWAISPNEILIQHGTTTNTLF